MNKSIALSWCLVLSVFAITIQATCIVKRETKSVTRPETPLLNECEDPGENRDNCFIQDPSNLENWRLFLEEIEAWEKQNPKTAEEFYAKNPKQKKEERDKLAELEKFAAIHEQY